MVVLVVVACLLSAGDSAPADLSRAALLYDEGRYDEALPLLDGLRKRPDLLPEVRVEVLRYQAFVLFLLALHKEAKGTWLELLTLVPDYPLDADRLSPEMVAFFSRVRPEPPPVEPTALSAPAAVAEPPRGCGVGLCLVPFGVGQFANDQPVKGAIFAGLTTVLIGANVGLYQARMSKAPPKDSIYWREPEQAERLLVMQRAALVGAALTMVAGVADAFLFP